MPMLDLSDAKEMNFDAIPAARYNCTVYEITAGETEDKPGAKLPEGTTFYNVQFRIDEGEYENRRLFQRYFIPDSSYEKADVLKGMFVSFLKALGYTDEDLLTNTFEFEPDDEIGKPILVTAGREPVKDATTGEVIKDEFRNTVKSVRAPVEEDSSAGGLL